MKTINWKLRVAMFFLALPLTLLSQSNQYLHFDRVDDYVMLPGGSQYILNSNAISMTGWFYTDQLVYGQGMMGFRSGGQGFYLIQLANGKLESRFSSSTGFYEVVGPDNTMVAQMWQHVAWVYDGTAVTLYINGVQKGTKAASGVISDNTIAFAIGKSLLGTYNFVYGGRADEVAVWTKGLTQAEVQALMTTEPLGTEPDLQLYYKFNQGVPGGNNTSITKLISEIGGGVRDADLLNFAMTGDSSNFNGTLNPGFQAISFPQIPPKLTGDPPFNLSATASSGLPVQFEILSGPATINGTLLTLTGGTGEVSVKATQPGGGTWNPANPVINKFSVYNPVTHLPDIDVRHPLAGDVRVPLLKSIGLAAIATITVPELFNVTDLHFEINSTTIPAKSYPDGHYVAWWSPPAYGSYTLSVISSNNYGYSSTESVSINIIPDTADVNIQAVQGIWLNPDNTVEEAEAELPSFLGAYDKITATLQVQCPPTGGCGEYDRIAGVEARGHDGQWHEIIRYITPYGVPCDHVIDLTDYMSLLNGKVTFRLYCSTLDNGYVYNLNLDYSAGIPVHPYSQVNNVWYDYYPFGDYANLQPVETFNFTFPPNAAASVLKLVSTGHGWGSKNTGNAAEFYDAIHHIWVNNQETFEQHNWQVCNPNPDSCMPQNGTWFYNRAGWCPGSIAPWFDYDMTSFITGQNVEMKYIFFPDYVDLCHPNHPACVTGVTCSDCMDGFNPALDVASNLIVFADNPIVIGINEQHSLIDPNISIYPNPSTGIIHIAAMQQGTYRYATVSVMTLSGKILEQRGWNGENISIDLSGQPKGMYFLKVQSPDGIGMKKFMMM